MTDILYHHRIASKDGQYVHIDEIITALKKQNHQVRLIGPDIAEKNDFGHDGGFVNTLKKNLPKFVYELMELGYGLIVAIKLCKAIKQKRPDVIYERYNLYQPVGVLVAKWFKIPLILEVNAPLKEERERFSGGLGMPRFAKWIENFTWRNASRVLPVTNVLAEHVRKAGVPNDRIDVVHNGVKESVVESSRDLSTENKETTTVGFVGFMHLTCGVEWAMEVIAEPGNEKVELLCVGDGNIIPELKERAASLGVSDRVEFTGLVGRDEVMSHVSNMAIALQPDVTAYASPLKMFEYMVNKCLIVAPDSENIREILTEDCAEFFEHGNPDAFKDALRNALVEIPELPQKRESAYNRIIEKQFTWDENARRIVTMSESLSEDKTTNLGQEQAAEK